MYRTPYVSGWEKRPQEIQDLTAKGIIPFGVDIEAGTASLSEFFPALMGQAVGGITTVLPAKDIVHEFVTGAIESLSRAHGFAAAGISKL